MCKPEKNLKLDRVVILETPYGWGIVKSDEPHLGSVHILLDSGGALHSDPNAVRTWQRSFAPLGSCVETRYGYGVVLDYRQSDGIHKVSLWRRRGPGSGVAWLTSESFKRQLPAIPGFPVEMDEMTGEVTAINGDTLTVQLPDEEVVYWKIDKVRCPVASVMPLVDAFLENSYELMAENQGLVDKLRGAVESSGMLDTDFQQNLLSNVRGALGTVTEMMETQSYDNLSEALTQKLMGDSELKGLLATAVEQLTYITHSDYPLANKLLAKHWAYLPSTLANRNELISTFDFLNDFQDALQQEPWYLLPSTLANRAYDPGEDIITSASALVSSTQYTDISEYIPGSVNLSVMLEQLQKVAENDPALLDIYSRIQFRIDALQTVTSAVSESKVISIIGEKSAVLQDKFEKVSSSLSYDTTSDSASELNERIQKRSARFIDRLKKEQSTVQSKVVEFAHAGVDRYVGSISFEKLEEWLQYTREVVQKSWEEYRVYLFQNLKDFDVQEHVINMMWVDPAHFPIALENMLASSTSIINMNGTEVKRLYSKTTTNDIREYTITTLLKTLEDNGVWLPETIVEAFLKSARGEDKESSVESIGTAIVKAADSNESIDAVQSIFAKGEYALDSLLDYANKPSSAASGAIMNAVLNKFEDDNLEDNIFNAIGQLDAKEALTNAESTLYGGPEALEQLANSFKDATLQFVLDILPGLQIPSIEGDYETHYVGKIKYILKNLDMSGFHFTKEDVTLKFPEDIEDGGLFSVEVHAENVSAVFKDLQIHLKQESFPYLAMNPLAQAKGTGITLDLSFGMDVEGSMKLTSRQIAIETLDLFVEETSWAMVVNTMVTLFSTQVKEYVKVALETSLDDNVGPLIEQLNGYIAELPIAIRDRIIGPIKTKVIEDDMKIEDISEETEDTVEK